MAVVSSTSDTPLKMCTTNQPYIDTETGEILYPSQYNEETGEYEGVPAVPQRTKFRIPPAEDKVYIKKLNRPVKVDEMELEVIKAAIFLIPMTILFHPLVYILTMLAETILHHWAHKKNSTLKDDRFYYKSPLHGIAKEFCGKCKESNTKQIITKIQDMRNVDKMKRYGLEYLRRVVT